MISTPEPRFARYPFDRHAPVHSHDRRKDRIPLVLSAELQNFIYVESEISGLRLCTKRYPCRRFYCPWCAGRTAAEARRQLGPIAEQHEDALSWVSSVKSEDYISGAWSSQHKVMRAFLRDSWLTRQTSGWLRETHITHGDAGWHVHTHWVMFAESRAELRQLQRGLNPRWLISATKAGVHAHERGQQARLRDDAAGTLRYATKGNMRGCSDGNDSLGDLWAKYQRGDAEAGALMVEFQSFFGDGGIRRWRATGGIFRGSRTDERPGSWDYLLDPDIVLPWPKRPIQAPGYPQPTERHERVETIARHNRDYSTLFELLDG